MLHAYIPAPDEIVALKEWRRPTDTIIKSASTIPTSVRTISRSTKGPGKQPATFWGWNVEIELRPSLDGRVRFSTLDASTSLLSTDSADTHSHWISLTHPLTGKRLDIVEHMLGIIWASRIAFDMRFYGTPVAPTLPDCVKAYVDRIFEAENLVSTSQPVLYATVEQPLLFKKWWAYILFETFDEKDPQLNIDLSVDYPTPWMAQRIITDVDDELLKQIAGARTSAFGLRQKLLALGEFPWVRQTLLRKFRQLSHTNVMAHSKKGIHNARPEFDFKSDATDETVNWELVYHELIDKLGALALLYPFHFLGKVTTHRTSHVFDVLVMKELKNKRFLKTI